jgi:hypothetical protein
VCSGAYYYYNNPNYTTEQDALLAVEQSWEATGLPLVAFQLDSWWYYKEPTGAKGALNWTAPPSVFPNGVQGFYDASQRPIVAHMRYWSPNVTYATFNGGAYTFLCDPTTEWCMANDPQFWLDLLHNGTAWNLRVLEHDWLSVMTLNIAAQTTDPLLGRSWMMDMSAGAAAANLSIQLCDPFPRHLLQSLEMPTATQTRSSTDYRPGTNQWSMGSSCMLDDAIGLACWKDCMWTSSDLEPGNPYSNSSRESAAGLQVAVSVLSAGPVGPADSVGQQNVSRILRTTRTDGLLLHPSVPATSIDATYAFRAFGSGGPAGEIWSSYSVLGGYVWSHVLVPVLNESYALPLRQVKGSFSTPIVAWQDIGESAAISTPRIWDSAANPIQLLPCNTTNFQLWHGAPLWNGTVALLGDLSKVVPPSPNRFSQLTVNSAAGVSVSATVAGAAGEVVPVSFYNAASHSVQTVKCVLSSTGRATVSWPQLTCINA